VGLSREDVEVDFLIFKKIQQNVEDKDTKFKSETKQNLNQKQFHEEDGDHPMRLAGPLLHGRNTLHLLHTVLGLPCTEH
jgi:hypothetical protein